VVVVEEGEAESAVQRKEWGESHSRREEEQSTRKGSENLVPVLNIRWVVKFEILNNKIIYF
jgi:hypothetical protein